MKCKRYLRNVFCFSLTSISHYESDACDCCFRIWRIRECVTYEQTLTNTKCRRRLCATIYQCIVIFGMHFAYFLDSPEEFIEIDVTYFRLSVLITI